jgi:hypothetical protein
VPAQKPYYMSNIRASVNQISEAGDDARIPGGIDRHHFSSVEGNVPLVYDMGCTCLAQHTPAP